MRENSQGPRSTRGLSITKSDRKRLARLDRGIGWLDRRMDCILVWLDKKEYAKLDSKRAKMDAIRKELRMSMKATKKARLGF